MEDAELLKYLELVNKKLNESTKSRSPELQAAISRFLSMGGKGLRLSFVISIAASQGKVIDDRVITAAAAVELVHLGSLVHDDIMDQGMLRHGQPTISSKEGVNMAILVGDYFLAKASAMASSISSEAGVLVAETIVKMCEGQAKEAADQYNLNRTVKSLYKTINGKTATLFSASCQLGGILGGYHGEQLAAIGEYGQNLGVSYQIMDDISDFTSTTKESGKSIGEDARAGNYTLPVLMSLQGPQKVKLKKLLRSKEFSSDKVLEILRADGSIDKTIAKAEQYKQEAYASLTQLNKDSLVKKLKTLVG